MIESNPARRRILVIDDNPAIHQDFRKILCPPPRVVDDFEALAFGDTKRPEDQNLYDLDTAAQGNQGFELVQKALAEQRPYETAFIDVRMPPGWDGVETTTRIWEVQPDLPVVLCTAYSDHSWDDLFARLGGSDRLIILKKPFENIEILQLASSLTRKWQLLQASKNRLSDLEGVVAAHTTRLAEEQEKFKAMFENFPEGIFQMGPDGGFLSANPAMARIYGYASVDELIGADKDVLRRHCVDAQQPKEFLARLESGTMARGFESEIRCRDGSRKWISQTACKVMNTDGTLLHYQGFAVDITAQKNLSKETRGAVG